MRQKFLLPFLSVLLSCPVLSKAAAVTFTAANEQEKNIKYEVISVTPAEVKVISGGDYTGDLEIPDSVSYQDLTYAVKGIGEKAFWSKSSLTRLKLPKTLDFVESYAIADCTELLNIIFQSSLSECPSNAFYYSSSSSWSKLRTIEGPQASADKRCLVVNGSLMLFAPSGLKDYVVPENVTKIYGVFGGCSNLKSVTLPSNLKYIGNYSFYGCKALESIVVPDNVTTIGSYAFSGCSNLWSATLGASITKISGDAFENCSKLQAIAIPDAVEEIGGYAFSGCTQLSDVTFGSAVSKIGDYAFQNSGVTAITLPESLNEMGKYCFYKCTNLQTVTFPSSLRTIGGYAFQGCSVLRSAILPDALTEVSEYTFNSCKNLKLVKIGSNTRIIGNYAFSGCPNLSSVELGERVSEIGSYAFKGDTALASILFPSSVSKIGSYSFDGCTLLQDVTFGENLLSIGMYAFRGTAIKNLTLNDNLTSIGEYAFTSCQLLESVKFGANITSTGKYAFIDCENLKSVELGEYVSVISEQSFRNCTSLSSILWSNSLTEIGERAFQNCSNLTELNLPNSLIKIGNYSFYGCKGVKSINFGANLNNIGAYAFHSCTQLKSVAIPSSVHYLGDFMMFDCSSLESVTLPDNLLSVGRGIFAKCNRLESFSGKYATPDGRFFIYKNALMACAPYQLVSMTTPSSITYDGHTFDVTTINDYCFDGITEISEVNIADPIKTIGEYAFYKSEIVTLNVGNSVNKIGASAFHDCIYLTTATLGENVQIINNYAFAGCTLLAELNVHSDFPPYNESYYKYSYVFKLDNTTFDSSTLKECILTVPKAAKETYMSRPVWGKFAHIKVFVEPNRLEANVVKARPGKAADLSVEMINEAEITAFQCDIVLPDGCTVQMVDGEPDVNLSSRAARSHSITASVLTDSTLRVVSYSSRSAAFTGNDGVLFNASLIAPPVKGTYLVKVTNIKLTTADGQQFEPEDVEVEMMVDTGIKGDANEDEEVNVTDLVYMTNHILGYATDVFNFGNADVNEDNEVNITDVVETVNIILDVDSNSAPRAVKAREAEATESAALFVEEFAINAGETKSVNIVLDNPEYDVTALQFNMTLPKGLSVESDGDEYYFDPTSRLSRSHVIGSSLNDDVYTVLSYSTINANISGNSGAVITMSLVAEEAFAGGEISLFNIIVTEANGTQHKLDSSVTVVADPATGIESILNGEQQAEYFDLSGNRVSAPLTPGFYIRRSASGVAKIFVR